jgi:hypothetical protein
MTSIPIIGVLTLIRHDLLIRLINSIDYPVDNFVILFQKTTNNFNFEKLNNVNIKKFTIITSSYNVGCSRGWNYIINTFPSYYWLICGDDTYFEKGSLEKIHNTVINISNKDNVYYRFIEKTIDGKLSQSYTSNFSSFIFTSKIFEKIGIFDENIYPAYYEDFDIWQRIIKSKEKYMDIVDAFIYSGDEKNNSSCSLHSVDEEYKKKLLICHSNNQKYFNEKWNNGLYDTPFNSQKSINETFSHENYFENQKILLDHIDKVTYTQFNIV